jgi:hypothetical protein
MRKILGLCVALLVASPVQAGVDDQYLIGESNCRVINPSPVANERVHWSGGCKDGFAEGTGRLDWFVSDILVSSYEGGMLRGQAHGSGDYVYASKSRYQGKFDHGEMHGRGTATSPMGEKLTAQFVHGEPVGEVDIVYKNGNHYTGKVKNGKRDGQGTMVLADGGRYVGEFKQGFWDGYGVMTYASGIIYDGDWKQGRREGKGYLKLANGDQIEGSFKDNKINGRAVMVGATGNRYDGDWKDDLFEGKGTMVYALGGRYTGEWKAGKYDGVGELLYAGGRQVAGEFRNGSPLGLDIDKQAGKTKYVMHESDPRAGAARRSVVEGASVPLDKSYAEMDAAQRAAVKALYPLMDESDEPPYPLKGQHEIFSWMIKAGSGLGVSGVLTLHVHVTAAGDAESVTIFGSPSKEMSEVATLVMLKEKFKPALCAGKPCPMIFPFAVKFVQK